MSDDHAFKIDKLQNNFESILVLKRKVFQIKNEIHEKLQLVKKEYTELMKLNTKKVMIFCLDAFFFQYKSFMLEIENIEKFRILLNNRMYCDYYKLYTLIMQYFKDHSIVIENDDVNSKSFPAYKELAPSQEYKLEDVKGIHANILYLINTLHTKCEGQRNTITSYTDESKIGYSISNFLNTLQYENYVLREQTNLFLNYLAFFHISQKKQLKRVLSKLEDFTNEMEQNLHTNLSFSIEDIGDENIGQDNYLQEDVEDKYANEFECDNSNTITSEHIASEVIEIGMEKAVNQLQTDTTNDNDETSSTES